MLTRIDHVGIACRNLAERIGYYESTFGLVVVNREQNEEQGVNEAMLRIAGGPAGGSYIQLIEPLAVLQQACAGMRLLQTPCECIQARLLAAQGAAPRGCKTRCQLRQAVQPHADIRHHRLCGRRRRRRRRARRIRSSAPRRWRTTGRSLYGARQ